MSVRDLLRQAFKWGPVFFGIGFIAPLVAQSLDAVEVGAPFGLSTVQFGLAVGIGLGTVAKVRGRWI